MGRRGCVREASLLSPRFLRARSVEGGRRSQGAYWVRRRKAREPSATLKAPPGESGRGVGTEGGPPDSSWRKRRNARQVGRLMRLSK